MLITKVKVSQVTNLSEARYCAGMGVDFLSFPISSIDPKTLEEITGWVSGPQFGVEADANTLSNASQYEVDFIQLPAELIDQISKDKRLVPVVRLNEWSLLKQKLITHKNKIMFLELESPVDEKDVPLLKDIANEFELLVPLSNTDAIDRILQLPVAGIRLKGGDEQRPGLKEYPLAEILEKLEQR